MVPKHDGPKIITMNKHAQALGKIGGKNRATSLSKERRVEIAKMGAKKRWETKLSTSDTTTVC